METVVLASRYFCRDEVACHRNRVAIARYVRRRNRMGHPLLRRKYRNKRGPLYICMCQFTWAFPWMFFSSSLCAVQKFMRYSQFGKEYAWQKSSSTTPSFLSHGYRRQGTQKVHHFSSNLLIRLVDGPLYDGEAVKLHAVPYFGSDTSAIKKRQSS